jgi:hypothetical protein
MSSLGQFHHTEESSNNRGPKIIAAIVVAVIIGGFALYAVESGMLSSNANTPQSQQNYPRGM